MIELSTRTKASYTYVKDWMMLRECAAGCLGSLQTTSHQNVKLKLRLPEGSPAKFVKISGALQITKRATGRDAEAALGDLRFGDKRDILVQLAIAPDTGSPEQLPQDPWESIVSGLEALGGPLDQDFHTCHGHHYWPLLCYLPGQRRAQQEDHQHLLSHHTLMLYSDAWSCSHQTCLHAH